MLLLIPDLRADAGQRRSRGSRPDARPARARVAVEISGPEALSVRMGFQLALQRVTEVPACGALFAPLGGDGAATLGSTSYARPRPGAERALCDRGALAMARAGRSEIILCPSLARLTREGVAAILIHEALHSAGLGERPVHSGAPSSAEITRLVLEVCALG